MHGGEKFRDFATSVLSPLDAAMWPDAPGRYGCRSRRPGGDSDAFGGPPLSRKERTARFREGVQFTDPAQCRSLRNGGVSDRAIRSPDAPSSAAASRTCRPRWVSAAGRKRKEKPNSYQAGTSETLTTAHADGCSRCGPVTPMGASTSLSVPTAGGRTARRTRPRTPPPSGRRTGTPAPTAPRPAGGRPRTAGEPRRVPRPPSATLSPAMAPWRARPAAAPGRRPCRRGGRRRRTGWDYPAVGARTFPEPAFGVWSASRRRRRPAGHQRRRAAPGDARAAVRRPAAAPRRPQPGCRSARPAGAGA